MKTKSVSNVCRAVALSMAVGTMLVSNSIVVNAQPKVMEDGTTFDAEYYAQKYPDVVAVYGTEEKSLFQHYNDYGRAENREAVEAPSKSTFDAEYYAEQNPDVVAVYGTGSNNLYQHYLQYGKAEGRKPVASADTKSSTNVTVAETKAEAETTALTETVGEPLQADLANAPLNLVELNQTFDYVRPCFVEPNETTIMQSVFKDYSCFVSDDTHEAVDGYVWQTVTFEMKMNDYNGWMYGGKGIRYATVSYYDVVGFDESYNDNTFSVNFNGQDYSDCMETSTTNWSGWDSDNWDDDYPPCNTFTWHYECRVPEGYDGMVMLLASDNLNDTRELLEADNQDKVDYSFRLPAAIPE